MILKKIGVFIGVFLFLGVATLVMLPLLIHVDQYRPYLQNAVNARINGKAEIGKLSLSLWGQIRVKADDLVVSDSRGHEVLKAKDAYFHLPLGSVLQGHPILTFHMDSPELRLNKNQEGNLNLLALLRPEVQIKAPPTLPAPGQNVPSHQPSNEEKLMERLPRIVTESRLWVEASGAVVIYQDDRSGVKSTIKDLNLVLKDLSLSHPVELEVWANLDTKVGPYIQVKGPARFQGKGQTEVKDGKVISFTLESHLNLSDLQIDAEGVFHKSSAIPAEAMLFLSANASEVKVEKLYVQFFNAQFEGVGAISQSGNAAHLHIKSNRIDLKPWVELVPLLKDYEIDGMFQVEASVKGPAEKLRPDVKGDLQMTHANFTKLGIGRKVSEGILGALKAVENQVPVLKGKIPSSLWSESAQLSNAQNFVYETISSHFSIENGKLVIPGFKAKAVPQQGIDFAGKATLELKDQSLKATVEGIDTYNLTHLRDVSVEQSGIKIDHVFAQGSSPVQFSVNVSCTLQSPCYSYAEIPEQLAKVALNNLSHALKGEAQEEVQKQVHSFIQKAPPAIQQKLNEGLKRLFH